MVKQEFKCFYHCTYCDSINELVIKDSKVENIINNYMRCKSCESSLEVLGVEQEQDRYKLEIEWISERYEK